MSSSSSSQSVAPQQNSALPPAIERHAQFSSFNGGEGFRRETALNPFAKEFVPQSIGAVGSEVDVALADSQSLSGQSAAYLKGLESGEETLNARDGHNGMGYDRYATFQSVGCGGSSLPLKTAQPPGRTFSSTSRWGSVDHSEADGVTLRPTTPYPSGKKGQALNANHLLNFHYDPIPRHPRRNPPPRRQQRIQPYNKELFLQANFRFLVSDFGDYMLNSSNPDKMLQWEDVTAVKFISSIPVQCPICLEIQALCPQISSCGHIFCFSCILQYLMTGEENYKAEYSKKCPLCLTIICSKELRIVLIDYVKNYQIGDNIDFTLLTRAKSSVIPFERNQQAVGDLPYSKDCHFSVFSKFTLTADAETSASKATVELMNLAQRLKSGDAEDLEMIPYVYAAMDQLELRKQSWAEHRGLQFLTSSPHVRQRIIAQAKSGHTKLPFQEQGKYMELEIGDCRTGMNTFEKELGENCSEVITEFENVPSCKYEAAFSDDDESNDLMSFPLRPAKSMTHTVHSEAYTNFTSETSTSDPLDDWESFTELLDDEGTKLQKDQDLKIVDKSRLHKNEEERESEDTESYFFYQSTDGQPFILHPVNMKYVLHHYGSHELLPSRIGGRILEMEAVIQSEAMRKHYPYLRHFPLTTTFQLCEIDLSDVLPPSAFIPFIDEIQNRENHWRWRVRQEKEEKARDERKTVISGAVQTNPSTSKFSFLGASILDEMQPSNLDIGGLAGLANAPMILPDFDEQQSFSHVTRLGFDVGHDAPSLNNGQPAVSSSVLLASASSSINGQRVEGPSESGTQRNSSMSFVDIVMANPQSSEQEDSRQASSAKKSLKKGKKMPKALLSTAGGRRH